MITCYGVESYTHLVCVAQRHAARDSSVHDPLLGHGDPYGLEADPNSASHAPTPAANIAGMAKILKLCLAYLLLFLHVQSIFRRSGFRICITVCRLCKFEDAIYACFSSAPSSARPSAFWCVEPVLHCGRETNVVVAGRGVTSISRLLSLVLPFTAGALLHALEGLCRQPYLPALALVGFALLQPSAISLGR